MRYKVVLVVSLMVVLAAFPALVMTLPEYTSKPAQGVRSNTVFFDNFDLTDNGWTHSGAFDEWERGMPNGSPESDPAPTAARSAPNVWATDLDNYYENQTNSWLMSPVIDLKNFSSAQLSFWIWYDVTAVDIWGGGGPLESPTDELYLEISVKPYNTWEETARFNYTSYDESTWINPSLDISDFDRKEIRLRFRLEDISVGHTDNGAYLDDLKIEATPLPFNDVAIRELKCPKLSEIENPVNVTIFLENKGVNPQTDLSVKFRVFDGFGDLYLQGTKMVPLLEPLITKKVHWTFKAEKYSSFRIEGEAVLADDEFYDDNSRETTTRTIHFFYRCDVEDSTETSRWTTQSLRGEDLWHVERSYNNKPVSHTGLATWWCGDKATGNYADNTDNRLITPRLDLSIAKSANLAFWTNYTFENENEAWDGGIVEATKNGLDWEQMTPKGGYDDRIEVESGNPLKGKSAFAHSSNGWKEIEFVLSDFVGGLINFSFRMGSDLADTNKGWFVDDIVIYGELVDDPEAMSCAPDPITRLRVDTIGDGNITISWEKCPAADFAFYSIYVSQSNFTDVWGMAPYDTTAVRVQSQYTISGLSNGFTYYFAVTATDGSGNENKSVSTVNAVPTEESRINHAPVPVLEIKGSKRVYENIYFYSSDSYDPDEPGDWIEEYYWDFGDGSTTTEDNPIHTYDEPGTYEIFLIVTDTYGLEARADATIVIKDKESHNEVVSNLPLILAILAVVAIVFVIFVLVMHNTRRPMIDRYLRRRTMEAKLVEEEEARRKRKRKKSRKAGKDNGVKVSVSTENNGGSTSALKAIKARLVKLPSEALLMEDDDDDDDDDDAGDYDEGVKFSKVKKGKDKPLVAKVVEEKPKRKRSEALVAKEPEEPSGLCVSIAMIKCPSCTQVIKVKVSDKDLEKKDKIHIKCPVCDEEGFINW